MFSHTVTNNAIILFSEDHLIESGSKLRLWHHPLLAIVLDYPLDYVSSSTSQRKPAWSRYTSWNSDIGGQFVFSSRTHTIPMQFTTYLVIKKRMQTIDTLFCREMFLCHCFFIHCWTTSRIGIVRKNAWFSAFQKTLGIR